MISQSKHKYETLLSLIIARMISHNGTAGGETHAHVKCLFLGSIYYEFDDKTAFRIPRGISFQEKYISWGQGRRNVIGK